MIELTTAKLYANLANVILVRSKFIFAEVMRKFFSDSYVITAEQELVLDPP